MEHKKKSLTAVHYAIFAISGLVVGGLGVYLFYELYYLPSMPAIQPVASASQAPSTGTTKNATGRGCGCGG